MNTLLNHINLITTDVPGLASFFETVFQFRPVHIHGKGGFVVLEREGFILTLTLDKTIDGQTYPGLFHIGFLQPSQAEVNELLEKVRAFGLVTADPKLRAGNRFGFYVNAPGDILVEVGTLAFATEEAA